MKVIAFYLPQFHEIPENNEWWGPGFTEWTNTRRSKPLFLGHYQPREPLNDNYYSLLDPSVQDGQAHLARKYGIDAFCYYHYWFNGRRLLEQPFENMLKSGAPDFPFLLSWANEPWSRAWNGRRRDVIAPQSYGEENDWKQHFEYLAGAFRDPRYLRVDGKPIFVIYRPSHFKRCREMLEFWRRLAPEYGFEGLHLLHVLNTFEPRTVKGFDGVIELEPTYTISHDMPVSWVVGRYARAFRRLLARDPGRIPDRSLDRVDYDLVWRRILARNPNRHGIRTYLGAFPDWDNSPRRGRRGTVFENSTPASFEKYFLAQLKRTRSGQADGLIFINAWNEWAEGAYLEPDKRYEFAYLEALARARRLVEEASTQDAPPS
ncbi:MAG: glycoside hydrolase family 99-like domain-containing protein [Thermoplasmata archaeon]|jgi:lipopolysaccharide biosynthesis protein